jgi:NAD-dependent SIR2 family protein deacetylase
MAFLARKAAIAEPTHFHRFLQALNDRGTLLRVYTQNIDALELKAGLAMVPEKHLDGNSVQCMALHGSLQHMRCDICCYLSFLELHYEDLASGKLPECPRCRSRIDKRGQSGKRITSVPKMRANVVLYGETHPNEDTIVDMQNKDMGIMKGDGHVDLLLVVGTSLKVTGAANSVRMFSKALHQAGSSTPYPKTIYLDNGDAAMSGWEDAFDVWIKADCQDIAQILLGEMGEKKAGVDSLRQLDPREDARRYAERRLDARPSWRWWST